MREVMSTTIKDFKAVAKDFMWGSRVSMMVCLYDPETDQMVIHGAWSKTTQLEDILIEVDEMDDDMIIMHSPEDNGKRLSTRFRRKRVVQSSQVTTR